MRVAARVMGIGRWIAVDRFDFYLDAVFFQRFVPEAFLLHKTALQPILSRCCSRSMPKGSRMNHISNPSLRISSRCSTFQATINPLCSTLRSPSLDDAATVEHQSCVLVFSESCHLTISYSPSRMLVHAFVDRSIDHDIAIFIAAHRRAYHFCSFSLSLSVGLA